MKNPMRKADCGKQGGKNRQETRNLQNKPVGLDKKQMQSQSFRSDGRKAPCPRGA